jgi:hypothetical protein
MNIFYRRDMGWRLSRRLGLRAEGSGLRAQGKKKLGVAGLGFIPFGHEPGRLLPASVSLPAARLGELAQLTYSWRLIDFNGGDYRTGL